MNLENLKSLEKKIQLKYSKKSLGESFILMC